MSERKIAVAFLTGQSDPRRNALSQDQREFLERSPVPPEQWCWLNFPYRDQTSAWRSVGLLRASWNNGWQYLRSRRPRFASEHRDALLEKFSGCDRVIFLAGSCGLELLLNLRLPEDFLKRVYVFAYGPVSRSLPVCASLVSVQGRSDFISRFYHPCPDHRVDCHHMDYLRLTETRELFRKFYESVIRGNDEA